jgi:hypothetical protein
MFWTQLFVAIIAVVLIWWLYKRIKQNPKAFSKESFSKSFFTMGVLALILIGFIALVVAYLRHT